MSECDIAQIPKEVVGLGLRRVTKGGIYISCENAIFENGHGGVITTLRRAAVSGRIGPIGGMGDYWADLLIENGSWIETMAFCKVAWHLTKNHWLRVKIDFRGPA